MKRRIRGAQVVSLIGLLVSVCCVPRADANGSVLVLYSDDRLLPANVDIDHALRATLMDTTDRPVEVYSEFLDRTHFSGAAYDQTVTNYLREKYVAHPPAAIVAAGNYAAEFMLRFRVGSFLTAPVVFLGLSKAELDALGPLPSDFVGVPVDYDYVGTIDQALSFHPAATHLLLVSGASEWDDADLVLWRAALAHVDPRITVEYLSGLPTRVVLARLKALDSDTVVVTPGYFKDGDGRTFIPRESVQLMAEASPAPVYGPFITFIGTGVVGGRMPSYTAMGEQAATIVNKVLAGVAPEKLSLPALAPSVLQIDWRQARRFGIEEQIPADAVVSFREPTFWQAYGYAALIGLVVILLQAGLIGGLLYERRLQRRTAAALEASERRMILAARTARLSNWAWSLSADRASMNGAPANGASQLRTSVAQEPSVVELDAVLAATHPADRETLSHAVRNAMDKDEELNVEFRVVEPNQVRWFAARGRAEPGNPRVLRGVSLDITRRKVAELQAEQDRTALRHLTRVSLLGQLSASIAHQLNQPLAAILGNAEAAQKMLRRDDLDLQELRAICDDIVTEDNRAAQVIRRLGALYKHGERELHPVDVNELIRETLELLRSDLVTRQVTTTTEFTPGLPAIEGERVQLQQVLLNLIVNAADAMSDIDERARALLVRTQAMDAEVRVSVSDCGRGIAASDMEHIFDPFWTKKRDGMGIGLAICRSITTAHGGSLTAVNNVAGGATFSITLPIAGLR